MHKNFNHSLAVTVDIEDWYHIPSVCGSPFSVYKNTDEFFESWTDRYDYLTEPTHRVLDLLEKHEIKATFFVVADVVKRYPGLVEAIDKDGHEIACHGLHHACKIDPKTKQPLISKEIFETNTKYAKDILEMCIAKPVNGYRAPNALIAGWMIDSLSELGFLYDSSVSVNSLYSKSDSTLQKVSSHPYHIKSNSPFSGKKGEFTEFPWSYWNLLGIKIPTSGGPMLRFLGSNIILKGLKQSLIRGNTIFYFHPLDISNEIFPTIGNNRPFYWTIKGDIIEKRIKKIIEVIMDENISIKPIQDQLED